MFNLWACICAPFFWRFILTLTPKCSPLPHYTIFVPSGIGTGYASRCASSRVLLVSPRRFISFLSFAPFSMESQISQPDFAPHLPTTGPACVTPHDSGTVPIDGAPQSTAFPSAQSTQPSTTNTAIPDPSVSPATQSSHSSTLSVVQPTPPSTLPSNDPPVEVSSTATAPTTSASPTSGTSASTPPPRRGPKGARHIQPQQSGRKTTWPPKKLAWLEGRLPTFAVSNDRKAFYDRLLWIWYKVFGRSLPIKQDPEGEIDEEAAIARPDPEECLTDEARSARNKEEQNLRQVWIILTSVLHIMLTDLVQILSNWYRSAHRKQKGGKSSEVERVGQFIESATNDTPALPRRMGLVQFYIACYWEERILATFKDIRDRELAIWEGMVASGIVEGKKKPSAVVYMNEAVAIKWNEETDEFKQALDVRRKEERKAAEDGVRKLMSPSDEERTPEQYQA